MGPAIETTALTRRFGDLVAVDHLDLVVEHGVVFGLLGSNGAGKTTAIKMLITLLPPTSGAARVAGHDVVTEARAVRRSIGYVPQLVSADAMLTGRENLRLFARLYGLPRRDRERRIRQALAEAGLERAADRLVGTWSCGMIRSLEIAQGLLHRPAVLVLDEPTVGLDPNARHAVWDRLRASVGQTTILLTTHDMDEAAALCGVVAILHAGRMVAFGAPAELCARLGPSATLEDVFVHFTGGTPDVRGDYRDVARTRSSAHRVG